MAGLDADVKVFLDASGPPAPRPATAEEQQRRTDEEEPVPGCAVLLATLALDRSSSSAWDTSTSNAMGRWVQNGSPP